MPNLRFLICLVYAVEGVAWIGGVSSSNMISPVLPSGVASQDPDSDPEPNTNSCPDPNS